MIYDWHQSRDWRCPVCVDYDARLNQKFVKIVSNRELIVHEECVDIAGVGLDKKNKRKNKSR